ncbi:phosphotransferase family protein [Kribbella sp. CA-294648]|uniref:phosphotransferase family protein n=1 Tax=Kribbella sp. CA-294648 TaxID=3239948 RepID=UPI003D9312DB
MVGGRFVVKFAWSRPAALRVAHEVAILAALGRARVPFLPEVVASSTDPVLLVTRLVPGEALFDVVGSVDRDDVGRQLAEFVAALHRPATRERVESVMGGLPPASLQPVSTDVLRERFVQWARPDQRSAVLRWCDWADEVLAAPRPGVLAHADLHGGNQVWEGGQLRVVVDFETAGLAEAEYDLRCFPGTGPGVELLTATLRHYQEITGGELSAERVMAWHLRTALGDALWRSEAGVPLPDHRTPACWVDDLAGRFTALGIDPDAPHLGSVKADPAQPIK